MSHTPSKKLGIVLMGDGDPEKLSDVGMYLGDEIGVHIRGIVDGFTYEYIRGNLWPGAGESFIVSTFQGGKDIMISADKAMDLVNLQIREFEGAGVENILVFCTGHFPVIKSKGLVIVPEKIIYHLLMGLGVSRIGVMVPEAGQIEDSKIQYSAFNALIKAASPFGNMHNIRAAAREFKEEDVQVILTDCMGFTEDMGEVVETEAAKRVIVPRVLIPGILKNMI